jgi:hypothetical protein
VSRLDERPIATLVERVAADLRVLASLARSVTLPPAARVDEVERTARAHLDELRTLERSHHGRPIVVEAGLVGRDDALRSS